ncbi:MAG: hypothetical protein K8R79_07805 [Calditrichales bacterium]|nr:hypothetical protein [Calditrichales bacterium]
MEPWEKVYINISKVSSFEDVDDHFESLSCVDCHDGNANMPNSKEKAHIGLIKDPSEMVSESNSCAGSGCHSDKVGTYKSSLHQNVWGMKKAVAVRAGALSLSECPALQEGFRGECNNCHATCGDCHISRPNSVGKGFISSHKFKVKPDQTNNCLACHGSRIAHDFLGGTGRSKDAHAKMGYDCMTCHTGDEMHGSATEETNRYNYENAASCEDAMCHIEAGDTLDIANIYHSKHWDDLSCFVCHAQKYNNCAGCHVNDGWKTDPVYQENNPDENFKIGLNPLPSHSRFKYATLRHAPIATDTYDNWEGVGALTNYDVMPTWKYTTPHSIKRFTARTDTLLSDTTRVKCWESCHIKGDEITRNKEFFLFGDYIHENWPSEENANISVIVDGKLPNSWDN